MELLELQSALQNLDNQASRLRQQMIAVSSQINDLYAQADHDRNSANTILNRASSSEDTEQYTVLVSQASAYLERAESCESSAEQMRSQLEGIKSELRAYRAEYGYYQGEAETNLANLQIAVEKLSVSSSSQYGRGKLVQALHTARQRIADNQSIVAGCRRRIDWIDQACGSGGDSFVKGYARR